MALVFLLLTAIGQAKSLPFHKDAKIAIIGAGPAGIHMASQLQKLGHDHITILETTHRIGGKAYTLYVDKNGEPCEQKVDEDTGELNTWDCVPCEMGPVYLHGGYRIIMDLLEEYGQPPVIDVVKRVYLSDEDDRTLEFSDWLSEQVMDLINKGIVKNSWWVPSFAPDELKVMEAVMTSASEYIALHEEIFGTLNDALPNRLSPEMLERLDMTFDEFADKNNLHVMKPLVKMAFIQSGYQRLDEIAAYYPMLFVPPELVNTVLQGVLLERVLGARSSIWWINACVRALVGLLVGSDATTSRYITTPPGGWSRLFEAIAATDKLDVKFGVQIDSGGIDRHLNDADAPVNIRYKQDGGDWVNEEFDFLMYTPFHETASNYVTDLTTEENAMFDKFKSTVIVTSKYQADPIKGATTEDVQAGVSFWLDSYDLDGGWYGDRYLEAIYGREYVPHGQTRVSGQFIGDPCGYETMLCQLGRVPDSRADPPMAISPRAKTQLLEAYESRGVTNVDFQAQFPWPYMPYFPQDSVTDGLIWDLFDMQGSQKTWWLGSSASWESILHVCGYNRNILKEYLGADFGPEYPLPGYAATQIAFWLTVVLLVILVSSLCVLCCCCCCCCKKLRMQSRTADSTREERDSLLPMSPNESRRNEYPPAKGSARCMPGFCC